MARRFYTILVLPDATQAARKFHISKALVAACAVGATLFLGAGGFFLTQYLTLHVQLLELKQLRQAAGDRTAMAQKVGQLEGDLAKLRDLDRRLRVAVGLDKSEAQPVALAQGGADAGSSNPLLDALKQRSGGYGEAASRDLTRLGQELTSRAQSLRELKTYLDEKAALLAATPTILPLRGLITAGFGYRKSPFTGQREFHEGLDIAAPYGTPILATADGVVAFAGPLAAYGNVVFLDHGHGFATFYGHTSTTRVREGQRVHRGDIIAYVGTTGRTTGPHVHYGIYVKKVISDPLKYLVDTAGLRFGWEVNSGA
jgi:murein DD-endopeptidase MepM/ murein hydrolase activator NlpD